MLICFCRFFYSFVCIFFVLIDVRFEIIVFLDVFGGVGSVLNQVVGEEVGCIEGQFCRGVVSVFSVQVFSVLCIFGGFRYRQFLQFLIWGGFQSFSQFVVMFGLFFLRFYFLIFFYVVLWFLWTRRFVNQRGIQYIQFYLVVVIFGGIFVTKFFLRELLFYAEFFKYFSRGYQFLGV